MTSNFNDYQIILQARKSKKFRELDDKVRTMAVELGKGNTQINKKEYQELAKQRDLLLQDYCKDITVEKPLIDKTLYQKIDTSITKKLDAFMAKFPHTKAKNVALLGTTGTGKTYCAKVIQATLQQRHFSVYFTTTFNLVKRMNDHMYGQDDTATTDFLESDLLIIDDLGAEPTIKNSDEYLYAVINERYANNKPFIITSNLSEEQILNRYEERLYGRLFDQNRTAVIMFNGKDLRIE